MDKMLKVIFFLYVLTVMVLSFHPAPPETPTSDKLNHFFAFFILAVLQRTALHTGYWGIFFFSVIFGSFIEFVQYFLPYRSSEYADIVADVFGALCGMFFIFVMEYAVKIMKERYQ